ncbi:MAG: BrnA antitoxin family protein [Chloroflexi bacterium]|nr:BrnA antitoxin family protein [Chloroflexota bacterium]
MPRTERGRPTAKQAKNRIPRFKNVDEAAEFWDTHSLADCEDELEEVTDVQFVVTRSRPKKGITVRLEEDLLDTLISQKYLPTP